MIIKQATRDEIKDISALYVETYNAPPWQDEWSIETASNTLSYMFDSNDNYALVAEIENEIVGAIIGKYELYYSGMQIIVKSFLVKPNMQNQGIGSKLLQELEIKLKEQNIKYIYLLTDKREKEAFYQERNYTTTENLIIMGKSL